ncbi:MAG: helix-turn-helix transcriptional regulator [Clostridia bacterium]|nr:helix-turn-helix transcriptional regulator [Clostridia bacterium]
MTSIYAAENLQQGFVPMVYGYYDRANMMESTPEIINHSHPLCEIMYVNEGAMSIETEEGVHRVGTGQFIWIDAGVRHWDLRFNNGLCSMMNIEYQYEAGEALAPELGRLVREDRALGALFEQQPRVLTLTDRNQVIFQLMKSIIPMADSTNEQSRHLCSLLCTQVMLEMARLRSLNQPAEITANRYITDALDILNSSYAEPLTASDVAERLHIHPSYLHRLFREYTSRTMKEHLQRIRIRHARELLSGTRKSIQEIADEVGFSSTQQFQQLFRRIVGVRPMDYRKQHQEKE